MNLKKSFIIVGLAAAALGLAGWSQSARAKFDWQTQPAIAADEVDSGRPVGRDGLHGRGEPHGPGGPGEPGAPGDGPGGPDGPGKGDGPGPQGGAPGRG